MRALAAALLMTAATPALATEWIDCADFDMNVSVSLLLGSSDVLAVVGARLDAGDLHWVSSPAYAEGPVTIQPEVLTVGQGFADENRIFVDLMDEGLSAVLAEFRVFKASEGDAVAYGGTLKLPGYGAWAIACTGP